MMKLHVSHWSTVLVALNARISCYREDEAQPSDCCSWGVVHTCHFVWKTYYLGEFLLLKSAGLVHLTTIYIDAVSVFKSWRHRKSENLTLWSKFQHGRPMCCDLPLTLLHDIEFSASLHGILDAPMWVVKDVW